MAVIYLFFSCLFLFYLITFSKAKKITTLKVLKILILMLTDIADPVFHPVFSAKATTLYEVI